MATTAHTDAAALTPEPHLRARRRTGLIRGFILETGELTAFAGRAMWALFGTPRYFSEILRLNGLMVRRTTFLLLAMSIFLGFSTATFGFFFLRTIGAGDFVGVFTGLLTQRQTSTTMFGYVVSASICCAIAAEIGAAKVQEEIDAYESTGVDTMQLIVGTRILAMVLFVPLGTVVSLLGQNLGNFLDIVAVLQGNGARQFLDTTFSVQSITGQFYAGITMLAMGVSCVVVACFYGMRASGGPASVGTAVARSLMVNLVLVHVLSAFFGVFFYGHDVAVPVGE